MNSFSVPLQGSYKRIIMAELLLLEGAGHGFKGEDAEKSEKAMLDFFAKRLKK